MLPITIFRTGLSERNSCRWCDAADSARRVCSSTYINPSRCLAPLLPSIRLSTIFCSKASVQNVRERSSCFLRWLCSKSRNDSYLCLNSSLTAIVSGLFVSQMLLHRPYVRLLALLTQNTVCKESLSVSLSQKALQKYNGTLHVLCSNQTSYQPFQQFLRHHRYLFSLYLLKITLLRIILGAFLLPWLKESNITKYLFYIFVRKQYPHTSCPFRRAPRSI